MLIEPKFEKLFLNNSYGYRPEKGAVKAIKRVLDERKKKSLHWALIMDIDDYFDNVDHTILQNRINAVVNDDEIVRLVMLCVKMGVVTKLMSWQDVAKGLPQGAVLSPLLANLYLHSFDQYVTSRLKAYVRYADDFVIFTETKEEAERLSEGASAYLSGKLKLSVNSPRIAPLTDGFDFLGMTIRKDTFGISDEKRNDILNRIKSFRLSDGKLDKKSAKGWSGITAYYGILLPEEELKQMDAAFIEFLEETLRNDWRNFQNQSVLKRFLKEIRFMSADCRLNDNKLKNHIVETYLASKRSSPSKDANIENEKIIRKRKQEYLRKESESSELVVATPGVFVGHTSRGVTIRSKGKIVSAVHSSNLKHVVIMSEGVSMSSNFLYSTMRNGIPIDIFSRDGKHLGSFLSSDSLQCAMWRKQAAASTQVRNDLAVHIIEGKLTNQLNLIKYYHKYHKNALEDLGEHLVLLEKAVDDYKLHEKELVYEDPDLIKSLVALESHCAIKYWECVRCLLSNDNVGFERRERHGAKDLVNSMLNYGYALLYTRCWQALLEAQLSPYDSVIHVRQPGKPTFVYDFVEMFRTQAVDRVVISLIQKNMSLEVSADGKLTDSTRRLLIKSMSERMYKRENYRGENLPFWKIIKMQAKEIADYFDTGNRFKPYKAKW